jgi:hypothetical protein
MYIVSTYKYLITIQPHFPTSFILLMHKTNPILFGQWEWSTKCSQNVSFDMVHAVRLFRGVPMFGSQSILAPSPSEAITGRGMAQQLLGDCLKVFTAYRFTNDSSPLYFPMVGGRFPHFSRRGMKLTRALKAITILPRNQ